jgi:antibiotic biosynthesis monooxygenase (ABM) superfamily enzyme
MSGRLAHFDREGIGWLGKPGQQRRAATAVSLFTVRATITKDKEAEFNHWYNTDHVPKVLAFPGAVSAHRYKKLAGSDKFSYVATYEFESEAALEKFLALDHLKQLIKEYDEAFGKTSERERFTYVQVWP